MDLDSRAHEIAQFFDIDCEVARTRLMEGFIANHHSVAADFRGHDVDQTDDEQLLTWYRDTDTYIWELSTYHLDPFFNYDGMCDGIATHLLNAGKPDVLVLGDGIGDLSMELEHRGLVPTYNDLAESLTSAFARSRFINANLNIPSILTTGFDPPTMIAGFEFDAVVALDFFEHVPNVEQWVRWVYDALRPGGIMLAQNAFAMGDDEHGGSIPMHLSANNHFVWDWDPLLAEIGFVTLDSGWRQK